MAQSRTGVGDPLHQLVANVPSDAKREHAGTSDSVLPLAHAHHGRRVVHLSIGEQEQLWCTGVGAMQTVFEVKFCSCPMYFNTVCDRAKDYS